MKSQIAQNLASKKINLHQAGKEFEPTAKILTLVLQTGVSPLKRRSLIRGGMSKPVGLR